MHDPADPTLGNPAPADPTLGNPAPGNLPSAEPATGATAYRLAPVPDEHLAKSRRMILAAAAPAGTRSAVVLGAGRCQEIPLTELAERFERLALIDQNRAAIDQGLAAAQLSAAARQKIDVSIADLTGLAESLASSWRAAVAAAANAQQAIAAMAACVDQAQPDMAALAPAGPFDLVIASCVISQLNASAIREGEQLFSERFATQAAALRAAPTWLASLQSLAERTERAFMSCLRALVAPGGRIYFAETVRTCLVEQAPDGAWSTPGFYRMTKSLDLADYVDARFRIEERGRWPWVSIVPAAGRTGKLFDVQALTLSAPAPEAER